MSNVAGIILAAGKGTRMKSEMPKCAHPVCGVPMAELIGRAMKEAGVERPIVVVGHGGETMQKLLGDGYDYVWQREQLGTGHAVQQAIPLLEGFRGQVLVSAGDTPLVNADTFRELLNAQSQTCADATIASAVLDDPTNYGRIVRGSDGNVTGIVEHRDASDAQRSINEVNSAIYSLDAEWLLRMLPRLSNENAQGEFYFTDVLAMIASEGGRVTARVYGDHQILVGVNDRWQLAMAGKELQRRVLRGHALNGVSIVDPDTTFIGMDVRIEPDAVIHPCTFLEGQTSIGARSEIGPSTRLANTQAGEDCRILMSHADSARVGSRVWMGPFAHLRPGATLGDGVKIGNFVEIKNADLSAGSKVNHLAYIGDASIGADTNIGAGTITCNYDGFDKHRTTIGANAFVGSNSTLVAPLTIGDGAMIAAGSVVNKDVPDGAAAFGRARQETKPEWAAQWRKIRASKRQSKDEA